MMFRIGQQRIVASSQSVSFPRIVLSLFSLSPPLSFAHCLPLSVVRGGIENVPLCVNLQVNHGSYVLPTYRYDNNR